MQNDLLTFGLLGTRIDAAVTTPNEPSDPINSCLRSNPRKTKKQGLIAASIDLFHNGGQIKYSFVLMLISLTSLVTTSKFQKNICFKTRAVGLINIKTKECKSGRNL